MTPPDREADCGGEVACEVAAAAADVDIERADAAEGDVLDGEGWVVCLFGCWVEAPALGRDGVCWRKAAKKVERKKGRWEDMLGVDSGAACGRERMFVSDSDEYLWALASSKIGSGGGCSRARKTGYGSAGATVVSFVSGTGRKSRGQGRVFRAPERCELSRGRPVCRPICEGRTW